MNVADRVALEEAGRRAHGLGEPRIPALNATVHQKLEGVPVGTTGTEIMYAFCDGWDEAAAVAALPSNPWTDPAAIAVCAVEDLEPGDVVGAVFDADLGTWTFPGGPARVSAVSAPYFTALCLGRWWVDIAVGRPGGGAFKVGTLALIAPAGGAA